MKNKGFTLVELLGVIVLLGILSVVIIPKIGDVISNSKKKAYDTQVASIKKGVTDFLIDNDIDIPMGEVITIKLGALKQGGYLPIDIKNPITRKSFSNDSEITVMFTSNGYEISLNLFDVLDVESDINSNSPIIVLNGNYIEYVDVFSHYEEKGASARSSSGVNLSVSVPSITYGNSVVGSVDTSRLGTYTIRYDATDSDGNTSSAVRTVIVKDSSAPVISFPSETVIGISDVDGYNLLNGVSVRDNFDNNVSISVNSGLSNIPGKYVVTYTATDSSGNQAIEKRVIRVENSKDISYKIYGKTVSTNNNPSFTNPAVYSGLGSTGHIDIIKTGKNLFDEESILMAIDGAKYQDNHYVFGVNQAYLKYKDGIPGIEFKENTRYTITIKGYSFGSDSNGNNGFTNFRILFKYTDGTESTQMLNYKTETTLSYTSTANKTVEKICMWYGYGSNVYISHIQLEEGTIATDFEPYTQGVSSINMSNHDPLMCLDDICDYIDSSSSSIVRKVGKYVVTGNEAWVLRGTNNNINSFLVASSIPFEYKLYSNAKMLNNYFKYDGTVRAYDYMFTKGEIFSSYYNSTNLVHAFYINTTESNLSSKLATLYSSGNPMIIYYELPQTQYEPISLPHLDYLDSDVRIKAYDGNIAVLLN